MSRLSLTALMIWALSFSGANCGSAKVQGPQSQQVKPAGSPTLLAVTLSGEHRIASLPVVASELTSGSEILEVTISKVTNPANTPVTVFVSLAETGKDIPEGKQTSLGNFSLYPPDQPGKYLLNAAPALRVLSDSTSKGHDVRLVFEMKRINEASAWTHVELTIAQPRWRAAER